MGCAGATGRGGRKGRRGRLLRLLLLLLLLLRLLSFLLLLLLLLLLLTLVMILFDISEHRHGQSVALQPLNQLLPAHELAFTKYQQKCGCVLRRLLDPACSAQHRTVT